MPTQTTFRLDPEHIKTNEQRIRPHLRLTPTIDVRGEDFDPASDQITLKLELLQHAGSLKARGAFTNLLTRAVPGVGVVAASGGNHGAAVAFATMKLGIPAKTFVPSVSSAAKVAQIRSYGAERVGDSNHVLEERPILT